MGSVITQIKSVFLVLGIFLCPLFEAKSLAIVGRVHRGILAAPFNQNQRYCTVKLSLEGIQSAFQNNLGEDRSDLILSKGWNRNYYRAQWIFGSNLRGKLIRFLIRSEHDLLYGKAFSIGEEVRLDTAEDFFSLLASCDRNWIERRYTYVLLSDGRFYFSSTGVDEKSILRLFSKHATHSKVSKEVTYAGEFYFRNGASTPVLVINNDSGTYAPGNDHEELSRMRDLLQMNLHGLEVIEVPCVPGS